MVLDSSLSIELRKQLRRSWRSTMRKGSQCLVVSLADLLHSSLVDNNSSHCDNDHANKKRQGRWEEDNWDAKDDSRPEAKYSSTDSGCRQQWWTGAPGSHPGRPMWNPQIWEIATNIAPSVVLPGSLLHHLAFLDGQSVVSASIGKQLKLCSLGFGITIWSIAGLDEFHRLQAWATHHLIGDGPNVLLQGVCETCIKWGRMV